MKISVVSDICQIASIVQENKVLQAVELKGKVEDAERFLSGLC